MSYYEDIRAHDGDLALIILDFLTEIWMYEIALYSSIDHAKKSYKLARSEVSIINDLMLIKNMFI